ncbi:MAG: hypothetical protein AAF449_18635, partial [Myxococcota bacterium]
SALLGADDTTFVLVSSPSALGVDDAEAFVSRLESRNHHVGAVILNRTTPDPWQTSPPSSEVFVNAVQTHGADEALAHKLYEAALADRSRATAEAEAAEALRAQYPKIAVISVPDLVQDVHDLKGLSMLRDALDKDAKTGE